MALPGGLGRRAAPDPRDRRHLLAAHLAPVPSLPDWHYWRLGPTLDQGQHGDCVGHGWRARLNSAPIMVRPSAGPSAPDIYYGCLPLDEWSDNDQDTDRQMGTSVRAGAKYLQQLGYIGEYAWAFDLHTAVSYVLGTAPVVIGVNWYDSFFNPDRSGHIRISSTAQVAGGHCLLVYGANVEKGTISLQNSWGKFWGLGGRCSMSFEDFERLIREDGEVADAVELKVKP